MKRMTLLTATLSFLLIAFLGCTNDGPTGIDPGPEVYLGSFEATMDIGCPYVTKSEMSIAGNTLNLFDQYCSPLTPGNGCKEGSFTGKITYNVDYYSGHGTHQGVGRLILSKNFDMDITMKGQCNGLKISGEMTGTHKPTGYFLAATYEEEPTSTNGCRIITIQGTIFEND